jgi:hypothetical protein
MTSFSPSELVFLHADQFIQPRVSPVINFDTVLTNQRKVNQRLMAIELIRAGILANLALGTIKLEQIIPQDSTSALEQLGQMGKVGGLMAGMLKSVSGIQKPRSHLTRIQDQNHWQATMLEASILEKIQDQPLKVGDMVLELLGARSPSSVVLDLMRNNLLQRGVLEKRKKLFGTTWKLSHESQKALTSAQLEPIKQMYAYYQNHDLAAWAQLEEDVAYGFSRSDSD